MVLLAIGTQRAGVVFDAVGRNLVNELVIDHTLARALEDLAEEALRAGRRTRPR